MKYKKLVEKIFSQKSNHSNAQVAVALVAGLAAGAVISILLAPQKGSTTRNKIAGKTRTFGSLISDSYASLKNRILNQHEEQELGVAPEVPHFTHNVTKKRKSDLKDLIKESHNSEHQIAQN